jgi:AraC-like DNA-binding protein
MKKNIQLFDYGFKCRSDEANVWPCFHRHNEIELINVASGQFTYRFGGAARIFSAGEMVCSWSSIPHQIIDVSKEARFNWLSIPLGLFMQWQLPENFSSEILQGRMLISSETTVNDKSLFEQWEKDLNSGDDRRRRIVALESEARIRRLALSLELKNLDSSCRNNFMPFSGGSLGKIEKMNLYIAQNYQRELTLERIAKNVGLHPNYAVSLFRSHCGIGIVKFISQLRVSHAQRLLSTSDMKITDIAFDSGFASLSSFYDVFKKLCGESPSEYRKKNSVRKL